MKGSIIFVNSFACTSLYPYQVRAIHLNLAFCVILQLWLICLSNYRSWEVSPLRIPITFTVSRTDIDKASVRRDPFFPNVKAYYEPLCLKNVVLKLNDELLLLCGYAVRCDWWTAIDDTTIYSA